MPTLKQLTKTDFLPFLVRFPLSCSGVPEWGFLCIRVAKRILNHTLKIDPASPSPCTHLSLLSVPLSFQTATDSLLADLDDFFQRDSLSVEIQYPSHVLLNKKGGEEEQEECEREGEEGEEREKKGEEKEQGERRERGDVLKEKGREGECPFGGKVFVKQRGPDDCLYYRAVVEMIPGFFFFFDKPFFFSTISHFLFSNSLIHSNCQFLIDFLCFIFVRLQLTLEGASQFLPSLTNQLSFLFGFKPFRSHLSIL